MSKGYVYVLSNPSMPGLLKIGRSEADPQIRAAQLYTTGVPEPFRIEFVWYCDDHEAVEKELHESFADNRKPGREFFEVEPLHIIEYLINDHIGEYGLTITSQSYKVSGEDLRWIGQKNEMRYMDVLRSVSVMPPEVLRQYLWQFYQNRYDEQAAAAAKPSNVVHLEAANG